MKLIKIILLTQILTVILSDNFAVFDSTTIFTPETNKGKSVEAILEEKLVIARDVCKTLTGNEESHYPVEGSSLFVCKSPILDIKAWNGCALGIIGGHGAVIAYRSDYEMSFYLRVGEYARCSKIIPSENSICFVTPVSDDCYKNFRDTLLEANISLETGHIANARTQYDNFLIALNDFKTGLQPLKSRAFIGDKKALDDHIVKNHAVPRDKITKLAHLQKNAHCNLNIALAQLKVKKDIVIDIYDANKYEKKAETNDIIIPKKSDTKKKERMEKKQTQNTKTPTKGEENDASKAIVKVVKKKNDGKKTKTKY
jgi:hypothetical protein